MDTAWLAKQDEQFRVIPSRQIPMQDQPYQLPPDLAKLVKVRCVGRHGFVGHGGKTIAPGQIGWLRAIDARDMVAIGKAVMVDNPGAP